MLDVLDLSLYQARDANFSADLQLSGCHFAVVTVAGQFSVLLHLKESAFYWRVVVEHIQGHFAGVEADLAGLCLVGFVFAADLVLKSTALHILIHAFVALDSHVLSSLLAF